MLVKQDVVYESCISTARWLIYDVPGNVGWIMYLVCLIRCFVKQPSCMEIPLVSTSLMVGVLPALAMLIGIAELISERVLKLDRVLTRKRLYRGFGALTWGGFAGGIVGANALFAAMRSGYSIKDCQMLIPLTVGGMLCALFAGLILKTFRHKNKEIDVL